MSGYQITCGECGKTSAAENWIETIFGESLPSGHFQCPACHVAVVRKEGPGEIYEHPSGETMYIPGETTLEKTEYIVRVES